MAEIAGVRGLFSTGWTLVTEAERSGRLRRLLAELAPLAAEDVPNARFLLTLARIASGESSRDEDLLKDLAGRAARLREVKPNEPQRSVSFLRMADMVVAAACLSDANLRSAGEDILQVHVAYTFDWRSPWWRGFLRRAHAVAVGKRFPQASPQLLEDPNLQLWIPASAENAERAANGAIHDVWLAHEDHILHLAGPLNDYLCFRYPLAGDFEFRCEAQNGGAGGTEGCVAFGGLAYETSGYDESFRAGRVDMGEHILRPCPYVRRERWAAFQRLALKATSDGVRFSINGHPMWTDPAANSSSPWLALRCFGGRAPVFRNLQITGQPVIPREVRMTQGQTLRGWFASYYPTKSTTVVPLPPGKSSPDVGRNADFDWSLRDGVIHGTRRGQALAPAVQSRLSYFRPLQNGETITYEFWYEPGRFAAHPALGRLAFLLDPTGVQLHWMTAGQQEWTGLAENNTVFEPLNRRGPRRPPLKPGEWNAVQVSLADDTLTLQLNDTTVYARKLEPENTRRFSLFHDASRQTLRVRNVVLRGDWPERLTAEQLADLTTVREPSRMKSDRQTLGEIFADRHVADSARFVRRRAAALPLEQRYAYLSNWVLPGETHATFRMALDFTPTQPAPPVAEHDAMDRRRLAIAAEAGRSARGGWRKCDFAGVRSGGNGPVFGKARRTPATHRADVRYRRFRAAVVFGPAGVGGRGPRRLQAGRQRTV